MGCTSDKQRDVVATKVLEKRITINLQPIAPEWLWGSAIAELKAISSPLVIQETFSKVHFKNVRVRSLGGMFMIVTFKTKAERNKAVSNQLVKDWFKTFKHWNGNGASLSRLVWLKVRGECH